MKKYVIIGSFIALVALTVRSEVPRLVSSSPEFWATGVNASTQKVITLTFDQRMSPGYTAMLGPSSLPPPTIEMNPSMSPDRKTFTVKVTAQPGKVYVLGLNEKNIPGVGFQNEKGMSAPPNFLAFQTAGTPAPDDVPPRAIRTNPANGETAVDPSRVKSVAITFDLPMNPKKHGMHLFENETAVDVSKAASQYSADGKTFVLGYNFKPGASYRVELNSTQDIGFTRTTRVPLWPVKFTFSTAQPR